MTIKYLDAKRIRGSSTGGASDALGTAVNGTNDGTSTNASTPINGQTSVEFDNNEFGKDMGTTSSFASLLGQPFSVSFWLHYAGVGNNGWGAGINSSNLGVLVTTGHISGTENGFVIGLDDNNTQKFYVLVASDGTTGGRAFDDLFTDAVAIHGDKWHHYVFNFDNTNDELKIYRDGSLVQTVAYTNSLNTPSATTRSTLHIGRQGETDQRFFKGELADVGIFNRLLTTGEITYLFNSYDPDSATASDNTGKEISTMTNQAGILANYKLDNVNFTNSAAPTDEKATLGAKADLAKTFDFTSATGWVTYDHQTVGTGGVTIDSSTDNRIEGASAPMEHHDRVVYDLGQAVSDTAWTLDFDFNYSAIATHRAWIPCSLSSIADVNNSTLDDNSMGIQINDNSGTTYFQSKVLKTGATLDETGTQTLSTNTTYYARVQRTSATEMKIQLYANASHRTAGTPTSHSTTITQSDHAGVTDLRYIVVGVAGLGNNPETTSFWVDNIKLVATAKNDSFDLPENTLFVETDTYKYHWLQDNEWKASGSAEFLVSPETYADSSNWTNPYGLTQDYASIDTTNKRVNFAFTTSNSVNSGKVFKLPHALSEKWILQYQLNLSALNGNDYYHIALCENDGLLASGGQGQSLHINTQGASYNRWTMGYRVMGEGTVNKEEAFSNSTWTANTEYYCTLTRGADSDKPWRIDFTVRTGSHTGSVVGTAYIEQGTSTTNGQHRSGRLRNESFKYLQHTSKGNGGSEEMVGYVRNVYLKDGATTI